MNNPTRIHLSVGMDRNGNKILRLKSKYGGFSVQTDPRILSTADRLHKGIIKDDADFEKAIKELGSYVARFGTERQWNILRKLGVLSADVAG
ncbi:MAG: hypothetical protein GF334_08715 [Candidatus Altiarchaeales archaeon]|nr:hypothetical protein [Candidatus Altiarchaeales archaeon]